MAGRRQEPDRRDAVVVGAGLAGLVAAAELEEAGASVAVVEARPRVGGRVRSPVLDGATADLGGQFVGPKHRGMHTLAATLGLRLVPAGLSTRPFLWRLPGGEDGVGFWPPLSLSELWSLGRALVVLKRLSLRVDPSSPWRSPGAERLDGRSFGDWLDEVSLRGRAREALAAPILGFATVGARELSLLQVLWWVKRAGGLLPAARNGSALRLAEGAQAVPLSLAARLKGPVLLGAPVVSVEQDEESVTVRRADGEAIVRARRAIVAVPPPALRAISFSPPLDAAQRLLVEELRFGRAAKVCAAAEPPAGEPPPARHRVFVGGSPLSIGWRTGGILAGLAYGGNANRPEEELVADLARAFGTTPGALGEAEAAHWGRERFSGGTYVVFGPGQIVRHGPNLRRPHGRVHFAGAERSSWPDQMEGAVESGTETARRVLSELRRPDSGGAP